MQRPGRVNVLNDPNFEKNDQYFIAYGGKLYLIYHFPFHCKTVSFEYKFTGEFLM